jgi:general secretion pathway protein E
VFELLVTNDMIRSLIHDRATESSLRSAAIEAGMRLMRDDGQRLVQSGITSLQELIRVTRD